MKRISLAELDAKIAERRHMLALVQSWGQPTEAVAAQIVGYMAHREALVARAPSPAPSPVPRRAHAAPPPPRPPVVSSARTSPLPRPITLASAGIFATDPRPSKVQPGEVDDAIPHDKDDPNCKCAACEKARVQKEKKMQLPESTLKMIEAAVASFHGTAEQKEELRAKLLGANVAAMGMSPAQVEAAIAAKAGGQ